METLRQRTIAGLKWSAIDHFASQGLAFFINIIIARILTPADYGIIGLIAVFLGIAQVFVNAGFSTAIIRKQDRDEKDFSTVFYYNVCVAILFYLLLFFASPAIAAFYKIPVLTPVIRVIGISIIISSLSAIHSTKLTIAIDFKTRAKISVVSVLVTGCFSIVLAYQGYGIWALVFQGLISSIMTSTLLWVFVKWQPRWVFSVSSFKNLFGFGSKLMISGLLDTIYNNMYQMVIGKKYSPIDVGHFSRAAVFVQLPAGNITEIIQRVTFPVLSEIQHDGQQLNSNYRRLVKMAAFIIFPVMLLLAAVAEPLIRILLTDKWLAIVPLMRVLCFSFMFYPIHAINLNLLQVKGRSDLFLRLEIIKKIIITIVLFASVPYGILVMCYGTVLTSVIALMINSYHTGQLIGYGFLKQLKDLTPALLTSLAAGGAAFLASLYFRNPGLQLVMGGVTGSSIYLLTAYVFKIEQFKEISTIFAAGNQNQSIYKRLTDNLKSAYNNK